MQKYLNIYQAIFTMKIVAVVGMTGSGKTEVAEVFKEKGYSYVRFGQAVMDEVKRKGLEVNEENERMVRQEMRKEHGMAVMAKFLIPTFDRLLKNGNIIADGLYSWEEYVLLKEKYGDDLFVLAVYSSPKVRYQRLTKRVLGKDDNRAIRRPLTVEQAKSRDYSEIENLHKAGPIAMADYTIVNNGSLKDLRKEVNKVVESLK